MLAEGRLFLNCSLVTSKLLWLYYEAFVNRRPESGVVFSS